MENNNNEQQITIDQLAGFIYKNMVTKKEFDEKLGGIEGKVIGLDLKIESVRQELKPDFNSAF